MMPRISLLCPDCNCRNEHNTRRLIIVWHHHDRPRLWFWCRDCELDSSIRIDPRTALTLRRSCDLPDVPLYLTQRNHRPDLLTGILLWIQPDEMRHRLEAELDRIVGVCPPFNWQLDADGPRRVNPPTPEVGE